MNLIVIFAVFSSFVCIDCINGLWIPPFQRFNHSDFQQRNSDQVIARGDNVKGMTTPFTTLWNRLWQRIRNPFKQLPKDVRETGDIKPGNFSFRENEKINQEIGNIKAVNDVYLWNEEEEAVKITPLQMNSSLGKVDKRSNENESIKAVKDVFLMHESKSANVTSLNVNNSFHSIIDNNAAMDMHNSSMPRNKEDLFTTSTCVLLDVLEFVCKILVLVFLSFMIMFLSITICLLVLGGMFLGIAYLLCGLKCLFNFFVLCYYSKNPSEKRHDSVVESSTAKPWLQGIGRNQLLGKSLTV